MFSDLYYLAQLLEKSLAFSLKEKSLIFAVANKQKYKVISLIKILEDEQKGWDFIKMDYEKKLKKLGDGYKEELLKNIEIQKQENINKIKKHISNMKILEEDENKQEDLDLLFNEI